MKRFMAMVLSMTLVGSVIAAQAQDTTPTATTKNVHKRPAAKKTGPTVSEQLNELKQAIDAQQQQIRQLSDQVQTRDQRIQQLEQRIDQSQSAAVQAQTKADTAVQQTAEQQQTVVALKSDVTDLKTTATNNAMTLQETQKSIKDALESPLAIHYKGITITPGGFLAAESVYRNRALASDINTPFNSVNMPGAGQNQISEFFGSGRQSRISLLAEGKIQNVKLSGYYEADFLSAGITSNNNQSNSDTLRQRQAWGQAASDNGWTFTGGQMWSLVTETKKGTDNRSEAVPMTIDPQYNVGFSWARQYGLRLAKNFENKVWFAVASESSQATVTTHGNGANFLVGSAGASGGLYNSAASASASGAASNVANYSFNPSPDVVAKLAFEPGFGHYEVFGVYSRFRDRVFPCGDLSSTSTVLCGGSATAGPNALGAYNASKNGGGIGANARWSFVNKHLDFGLHGLGGVGIGRYGTGGLPDASVHANGTLDLIHSYQGLTTLEWHGPKLDVYMNAGAEYASRADDFDPISGKQVGYGAPTFKNSGCYTETIPGATNG